ncbi:4Fe-4S dicluster domain-containing protein [Actinotalea sp. M2MS4P-6]|uniref:ferredoxin family protein n=1 Tax=Actinotalea sp. M2MS4P-6 TaxID=2983762 RepID=UPI0021E381A7|nr:4Fe-4S dicluster domain-containing protein [Actinotalea sp. M2MS4P-6]MCV2394758.1 4Fe-4S dicluster domain-containing protein [Actinotalea sp. M2MS4P-6]
MKLRAGVRDRLSTVRFVTDDESHIEVNQEVAKATGAAAILVAVCPAKVYSIRPDGSVGCEFAACLECGTCLAVAPEGSLTWHYPRGGFGVEYRQG